MVSREEVEEMLAIVEGDEVLKERLAKIVVGVIEREGLLTRHMTDAVSRELARRVKRLR